MPTRSFLICCRALVGITLALGCSRTEESRPLAGTGTRGFSDAQPSAAAGAPPTLPAKGTPARASGNQWKPVPSALRRLSPRRTFRGAFPRRCPSSGSSPVTGAPSPSGVTSSCRAGCLRPGDQATLQEPALRDRPLSSHGPSVSVLHAQPGSHVRTGHPAGWLRWCFPLAAAQQPLTRGGNGGACGEPSPSPEHEQQEAQERGSERLCSGLLFPNVRACSGHAHPARDLGSREADRRAPAPGTLGPWAPHLPSWALPRVLQGPGLGEPLQLPGEAAPRPGLQVRLPLLSSVTRG